MSSTRRLCLASCLIVALLTGIAGSALAANPHFVWVRASVDAGANLIVRFKEAGLGDNEWVNIRVSANATASFACRNNGGNFPRDPKKHLVTEPVSREGLFESDKNGNVTGTLVVEPPDPGVPPDFCPGNQHLVLIGVKYSSIRATDLTNGVTKYASPSYLIKMLYRVRWDPWNI